MRLTWSAFIAVYLIHTWYLVHECAVIIAVPGIDYSNILLQRLISLVSPIVLALLSVRSFLPSFLPSFLQVCVKQTMRSSQRELGSAVNNKRLGLRN